MIFSSFFIPLFAPDLTLLASTVHRMISIYGDFLLFLVGSLVEQGNGVHILSTD